MASQNYQQHALPTPSGQPQNYPRQQQVHYNPSQQSSAQPQQPAPSKPRPRSRGISFRSDKSHRTSGSHENTPETHNEKESKRLHSKADPTMAMNEAEPAAVAAQVKKSLGSIRDMQHKDMYGNPISEPDRSNPTRSRWERPLDTIRSFEAAVDGGYNLSDTMSTWNKRSSYYGGNGSNNNNNNRFAHESYYGGRPQSTFRPDGMEFRQGTPRESYYDQQQQGQNQSIPPGRQRYPRTGSEPQFNTRQAEANVYALPANHRSYETVASGSGSAVSQVEQGGYQTDPTSSDNSSIERQQSPPKRKPEPTNDYGIGFNQTPEYQPSAFSVGFKGSRVPVGASGQHQSGGAPPPVPQKDGGLLRKPTANVTPETPDSGEKRKSWLMRRLSKQS